MDILQRANSRILGNTKDFLDWYILNRKVKKSEISVLRIEGESEIIDSECRNILNGLSQDDVNSMVWKSDGYRLFHISNSGIKYTAAIEIPDSIRYKNMLCVQGIVEFINKMSSTYSDCGYATLDVASWVCKEDAQEVSVLIKNLII